jgi:hypothetical protein
MKRGAATASHRAGIPESEIQVEGGWTNAKTVKLYIDRDPRSSQKLAKKIVHKTLR